MREEANLRSLSDDALLRRLSEILGQCRRDEASLVAHIAEVDARRAYAREAAPSMHAYCTEVLHLSEPETWLRIRVARASRKHPMVLEMLRDGRIHLSGIALLAPHLTPRNCRALLKRATHESKRRIEEIVAELEPKPDAPATIRKLPERRGLEPGPQAVALRPDAVEAPGPDRASAETALSSDNVVTVGLQLRPDAVGALPMAAPSRPATLEPLGSDRHKVQFTASTELRHKLERLQALMRSSVPDADLAKIIDVAVTEKLERLEAKRIGKTKAPRKSLAETDTTPTSRHVPAAVRRAVWKRDGGRCTYVDKHGRRCTARDRLEFHHHGVPFGRGGDHSPGNVRLACKTHNALLAEQDFGKEKISQYRRKRPPAGRVSEVAAVYAADNEVTRDGSRGDSLRRSRSGARGRPRSGAGGAGKPPHPPGRPGPPTAPQRL